MIFRIIIFTILLELTLIAIRIAQLHNEKEVKEVPRWIYDEVIKDSKRIKIVDDMYCK